MREIKFRAWDKSSQRMLQVVSMSSGGMACNGEYTEGWFITGEWVDYSKGEARRLGEVTGIGYPCIQNKYDICDIILMQYTGLKDKHGVEIYEGDVLHFPELYGGVNGVVRWVGVRYYCLNKNHDNANSIDGDGYSWVCNIREVIGNIYENPELLDAS